MIRQYTQASCFPRLAANPEKVQAAMDFVQGWKVPGPPPMTLPGAAGFFYGKWEDSRHE